jgi:hypothetical protein
MSELAEWGSFYVIVGTAAGALIGLQFVVMTLLAQRPPERLSEGGPTFLTPTIVHFSCALLLSALMQAPWRSIAAPAFGWSLVGVAGAAYETIVARRMWRVTVYRPVLEDWLFHVLLPIAAYAALPLSAFFAPPHTRAALFAVGIAALTLLFTGIHNAWDIVIYHVIAKSTDSQR